MVSRLRRARLSVLLSSRLAAALSALTRLHTKLSDERGAELVQMAFVLPILLALVGGVIDYGILLKEQGIIIEAARVSARRAAALMPTTPDWICVIALDTARDHLTNANINAEEFTVTAETEPVNSGPSILGDPSSPPVMRNGVRVTISRPSRYYFLPWHAVVSSASAVFLQEDNKPTAAGCTE